MDTWKADDAAPGQLLDPGGSAGFFLVFFFFFGCALKMVMDGLRDKKQGPPSVLN
jgi:hypothetical protein